MPYIPEADRARARVKPATAGELTYALTMVVQDFLLQGDPGYSPRFHDFAEALGALEATKLELYRRVISLYENSKLDQNGDVY